ncbi:hypothetical protein SDC9_80237 [bioreactor metagenome]|uniref:Uncharacterized protein n=1 Tax=bioreactor metagenome TaxID=1076179 RepID=A0A644YYH8_9ZZZZ
MHYLLQDLFIDVLQGHSLFPGVPDDFVGRFGPASQKGVQVGFPDVEVFLFLERRRQVDLRYGPRSRLDCQFKIFRRFFQLFPCEDSRGLGSQDLRHDPVMTGHDLHDPVPVEVFHEVAQKLVQPPGVFLENLSVAEIHGGQKIAEVVDYIVIHQLLSSLVHLAFKSRVTPELLFEHKLGNFCEPLIIVIHQETHFSQPPVLFSKRSGKTPVARCARLKSRLALLLTGQSKPEGIPASSCFSAGTGIGSPFRILSQKHSFQTGWNETGGEFRRSLLFSLHPQGLSSRANARDLAVVS